MCVYFVLSFVCFLFVLFGFFFGGGVFVWVLEGRVGVGECLMWLLFFVCFFLILYPF